MNPNQVFKGTLFFNVSEKRYKIDARILQTANSSDKWRIEYCIIVTDLDRS